MSLQFFIFTSQLASFISILLCEEFGSTFLQTANDDVNSFHKFISNLGKQSPHQHHTSSDQQKGHLQHRDKKKDKKEITSTGGSKKHSVEKKKKQNSEKEKRKKQWGESGGINTRHKTGNNFQNSFHDESHHQLGDVFKDAHKYNKGNYEKGFREKYHLDESKKYNKFWKNLDSHKNWKIFGSNNSKHGTAANKKKKSGEIKAKKGSSNESTKGGNDKRIHSTHNLGHQKEAGQEITYSHEKNFHH